MEKPYKSQITETERVNRRTIAAIAKLQGMTIQDMLNVAVDRSYGALIDSLFYDTSIGSKKNRTEKEIA